MSEGIAEIKQFRKCSGNALRFLEMSLCLWCLYVYKILFLNRPAFPGLCLYGVSSGRRLLHLRSGRHRRGQQDLRGHQCKPWAWIVFFLYILFLFLAPLTNWEWRHPKWWNWYKDYCKLFKSYQKISPFLPRLSLNPDTFVWDHNKLKDLFLYFTSSLTSRYSKSKRAANEWVRKNYIIMIILLVNVLPLQKPNLSTREKPDVVEQDILLLMSLFRWHNKRMRQNTTCEQLILIQV